MTPQQPSSTEQYEGTVAEAIDAFATDPSYCIALMKSANSTANKRLTFEIRNDLEKAEAEAHKQCEAVEQFFCRAKSPCGTGDCKFAQGEMALAKVKDSRGLSFRPQLHSTGSYSLEDVVIPLRDIRIRRERSRLERSESRESD